MAVDLRSEHPRSLGAADGLAIKGWRT